MKIKCILLNLSILCASISIAPAQTISLNEALDALNKDSLKRTVQDLQDFESRLCIKTEGQNRQVAQYLVERLKMYGIENARIDSFYVSEYHWLIGEYAQFMYNVIGTLKGTTDSTVIIGAHLDAISYTSPGYVLTETAPGADDNATGCAIMIEMARIINEKKLKPRHNIDFMAYDAEEMGLKGAYYDAEKRREAKENVIVMLNNDMVGYQPQSVVEKVVLHWYDNALDVTEKAKQALIQYTTVTPYIPDAVENGRRSGSDSYAYFQNGFKANFAIENFFSPYYHSENDLVELLNFEYCRQIARMNFVLLADYADMGFPLSIKPDNKRYDQYVEVFFFFAKEVIRVHNYNDITINQIDIFDCLGSLKLSVSAIMPQQNILSIDNLSSGIYFLRISSDKGFIHKKIIKQ
jgi:leucyl aminopeptidase